MRIAHWQLRARRGALLASSGLALAFPFGSCDFGEFEATSTVTLDGREVVTFLVRSALLGPLEQLIDQGIDYAFDRLTGEEDP